MTMSQPDDMLAAMFSQRAHTDPKQEKAVKAYRDLVTWLEIHERETAIANTWLFCSCKPAWTRVDAQTPPGHALCIIHGAFMITRDGRVL
jgi:hypothetical protein